MNTVTNLRLITATLIASIADAVVKVDLPELSSIYRNKNHESPPALFAANQAR